MTYFLNGGRESPFPGEERCLIPSAKVKTYDLKPEMSAKKITDALVKAIKSNKFDFIAVNYANPDMVGHTGNLAAAVKAAETIDLCLKRVTQSLLENHGQMLITADHGNLEQMINSETKKPHTAHTCSLVPCIIISKTNSISLSKGSLCNIAPTILNLMDIPIPKEMKSKSLMYCTAHQTRAKL